MNRGHYLICLARPALLRLARYQPRRAIGFVEIMVAILIAAACGVPIYLSVTSSRTETSKAINYLRAMELANEVIEWANVTPFDKLTDAMLSAHTQSLVVPQGTMLCPESIKTVDPENAQWKTDGLTATAISYPEQYNKAFYFRSVSILPIDVPGLIASDLLKQVTVEVSWNEGKTPANPNVGNDRMRKVTLSTLIYNDEKIVD